MICYKGKTFCQFWQSCNDGNNCPDKLTANVWNNAKSFDLPVSQFVDEPKCFKIKESTA